MKSEISIEQLLRWRLSGAEAEAPPAPQAGRLLELASSVHLLRSAAAQDAPVLRSSTAEGGRPWWEVLPERFERFVQRLGAIQVAYGHAMAEPSPAHAGLGHRVATLIVRGTDEMETAARILYFAVREGRLRLRFHLERPPPDMPPMVDVTFIAPACAGRPLFCAQAMVSVDAEYRLEAELPAELAPAWEQLKVTDRMPFHFIVRADRNQ